MPCGSIHIVADDRISFFFMAGSYSIVYIYNVCIMCIYILYYNIMFNSLYLIYNYINVIYIIYAYILYIYTKSSLSITFCNEHLAYFHILAVMLLWTLGCICLFELVFLFLSDITPGSGNAGPCGSFILGLLRIYGHSPAITLPPPCLTWLSLGPSGIYHCTI